MPRERIVFDTNVLISSLFIPSSNPARAFEHAVSHAQIIFTQETLEELEVTLAKPRLDRYLARDQREELLARLKSLAEIARVSEAVRASRDPRDDKILEAAVNGGPASSSAAIKTCLSYIRSEASRYSVRAHT